MFRRYSILTVLFLGAVLVAFSGCGKGGLRGLVPVSGVVLYNGEPIEGAQLTFAPDAAGEDARSGLATTDANGAFQAMTLQPGDGLKPGVYKISVRKTTEPKSVDEALEKTDGDEKASDAESAKMSYLKDEVKELLPMKYAAPQTSGLSLTVEKGGGVDYKIELTN